MKRAVIAVLIVAVMVVGVRAPWWFVDEPPLRIAADARPLLQLARERAGACFRSPVQRALVLRLVTDQFERVPEDCMDGPGYRASFQLYGWFGRRQGRVEVTCDEVSCGD